MKALNNLRLLAKLTIPALLLVAVSTGLILLARSSLSTLDQNTKQIVDASAARAILALQIAFQVDEATIREKNIIIETGRTLIWRSFRSSTKLLARMLMRISIISLLYLTRLSAARPMKVSCA